MDRAISLTFAVAALAACPTPAGQADSNSFAVVELFTSEGCSSCPPADQLFRKTLANAKQKHQRVYGLAFHVDYWNRLGWTDPFSDERYTARQRLYARARRERRIYTPQAIVNGAASFVASNRRKMSSSIQAALRKPEKLPIHLTVSPTRTAKAVRLSYQIPSFANHKLLLNLALVQHRATTQVARGENRGRTLLHVNIVRAFKTLTPDTKKGTATLQLPNDLLPKDASAFAYLQHPESLRILGAVRRPLPSSPSPNSQVRPARTKK